MCAGFLQVHGGPPPMIGLKKCEACNPFSTDEFSSSFHTFLVYLKFCFPLSSILDFVHGFIMVLQQSMMKKFLYEEKVQYLGFAIDVNCVGT